MNRVVLSPAKIGAVEVKNRIIFPSMCLFFCDEEGYITDEQAGFLEDLAKGGTGLIVLPGSPHGKPGPGRPALSDDKYIPGWTKLADTLHRYGAKFVCQLHPAAVQRGRDKVVKDIEDYEINFMQEILNSYADCALRAKKSGVDAVEIHGAHAHEIAQFMSPRYNHRTDAYGGSTENRARYSRALVRTIKAKCGADYPVIFRISGDELIEGGRELPETIEIIKMLCEDGIDAVHVSVGMPESEQFMCAPMDVDDLFNVYAAAEVKKAVDIPVIAVGRITTFEQAEEIVASGKADFVAVGRCQVADTAWVNKGAGIDPKPIRYCIGCNQGCRDTTKRKKVRCMQNIAWGNRAPLAALDPSKLRDKKVLIVGAGPAGLETALLLAEHGVNPLIYDRNAQPGGLARLAALPPHKENMRRLVDYRVCALKELGIDIYCGVPVDTALIQEEQPDVLIVATGSSPLIPRIKGIDAQGVYTGDAVFELAPELGSRVAVLGGGLIGCEVAETLASQGKHVEIFEMADDIATDLTHSRRVFMLGRMRKLDITVHTQYRVKEVCLPEIIVEADGVSHNLGQFDSAVVAVGRAANNQLLDEWKSAFPKINIIEVGDVAKPGLAIDAIHSALDAVARAMA